MTSIEFVPIEVPDPTLATLKPAKKGFWGYGAVVQAPEGTIWKVATSSK